MAGAEPGSLDPTGSSRAPGVGGGTARVLLGAFVEHKLAAVSALVIVAMVALCFLGPLFYHTNQTSTENALLYSTQNAPPSAAHPLGTDATGFDILGRIMYGGRTSLTVGFAAAVFATVLGVAYGAVAGYLGGVVDAVMMRVVDVLLSVPALFLLITLTVVFSSSTELIIVVIGFLSWLVPARLVRGEALTLRVREYVQAVVVMGGTRRRVVLRHIVPNSIGTVLVNATFQVADAILLLAALGFLGLGIPAPGTDWGSMLSDGIQSVSLGYWWEIYPAAVAIVLVVVSLNFVADALRETFDVRLRER